MKIKVKLLRPFSEMVGRGEVDVEVEKGSSILALFEELGRQYPKFEKEAFRDGELTDYISIFVNDKPLPVVGDLNSVLNDGDELLVFFPVSGG